MTSLAAPRRAPATPPGRFAMLAALGPHGIAGRALDDAGITLVLTTAGVVVAMTFVASPFYIRQAQAAFESVDPRMLEAARTLGAAESRRFGRIAIPLARNGLF